MNAAVISNGTIRNYKKIKSIIEKEYDFIVCADGGAYHANEMNLTPDILIGDFDSITPELLRDYSKNDVRICTFSKKKDKTDTHLAVDTAIEKKVDKIGLFGCRGTREDHTLANIQLLFYIRQNKAQGILIDDYNEIFLSETSNVIQGKTGDVVSLLSLSPQTKGITLKGFLYPLKNATLSREDTLGISNELTGSKGYIYKTEGDLLIIRSED